MADIAAPARAAGDWLRDWLPRLVLSPSLALVLVFVYGFILFTLYLSFTSSKILPAYDWVGLANYTNLFGQRNWSIALRNLAIFGSLYIVICCLIGLGLAILLDQKIRAEGFIRTIYLY
ncbi:MAG TPA: sugar ABC transporter permease, partial [Paracoccaceae bacterium]|nr:sugar ABC transporter permease [Paracoccaceae bacterium]